MLIVGRLLWSVFSQCSGVALLHRPCHSRATSDGHSRYRADSHGQCHSTDDLAQPSLSCLNASREYAR
jgi:hypothetical protein